MKQIFLVYLPEFCRWFFNSQTKQECFSVSILNSFQNFKTACTFQLSLSISLSKIWLPRFFELLSAFIDLFGKESLSDDEFQQNQTISPERYEIPDECLRMKGSPENIFDAFLKHSPYLNHLWKTNEENFGSDATDVKIELYTFIKNLRFLYKKSFYLVLNHQEEETETIFQKKKKD